MGSKKVLLGLIVCFSALLLAACSSGGNTGPTPTPTSTPSPTPILDLPLPATSTIVATEIAQNTPTVGVAGATPTKSTTTGRPTAPVVGWDSKVVYEKSGGIAGIKKTLLVGPAGQARYLEGSVNSGPVRLTPDRLAKIKAKLDATDFANLKEHYGNGNVADDFTLTLTLTQGDLTKTVVVEEEGGKGVTPQPLLDLLGELEALRGEIEVNSVPTATPVATATSAAPAGTATVAGSWDGTLTYERTGGFASMPRMLKVGPNGQARFTEAKIDTGPVPLAANKLADLKSKVDAAHFFDLKEEYGIAADDGYVVKITLEQGGRTKSVTISQGNNDDVPAELSDLMIVLNSLAEEVRGVATPVTTP